MKTQHFIADEWIRTDPEGVRRDVIRLGLEDALEYQFWLIADRQASGDRRWDDITEAQMRAALVELMESSNEKP